MIAPEQPDLSDLLAVASGLAAAPPLAAPTRPTPPAAPEFPPDVGIANALLELVRR